jgi:hypothetical protein
VGQAQAFSAVPLWEMARWKRPAITKNISGVRFSWLTKLRSVEYLRIYITDVTKLRFANLMRPIGIVSLARGRNITQYFFLEIN